MSLDINDERNVPTGSDADYEAVASQEEFYLEEVEEELRAIFVFDDSVPSQTEITPSTPGDDDETAMTIDEELQQASEELITGDSDDPPLSEDAVVEMLGRTELPKIVGPKSDA